MPDIRSIEGKEGGREATCSRCGADAGWRFLDEWEKQVEVVCPDCGRFEMTRAEFEQAEADIVGPEERLE